MPIEPKRNAARRLPRFVFVLLLADLVSLGLIMPGLPGFVAELSGPGANAFAWYGGATLAYALGFFISAGTVGRLSDALGRRRLMLAGCAGLAAGNLMGAFAGNVWWLVAGRLLCGLSSVNITLAPAYVADFSAPEERGRLFGLLAAMQGLGFILGPVVGGFLGQIDLRAPFFAAGLCTVFSGLAGLALLVESLPADRRRPATTREVNPLHSLRLLSALRGFGAFVPAVALFALAQNIGIFAWVPYATARFGWDSAQNGIGLFVYGICVMVSQGAFFPWAVRKFPVRHLCVAAIVSSVAAYLAFGFAGTGWIAFAAMAANVAGYGTLTAFQTLASGLSGERTQGAAMGGLQTLNSLALVAAPVPTAALLDWMSRFPGADWRAGLPMYACAILAAGALVMCLRALPKRVDTSKRANE